MTTYCLISGDKMSTGNKSVQHIVEVSKCDDLNRARVVVPGAECNEIVADTNAGGVPCMTKDEIRVFAAEMENEGTDVCADCVAEFYGNDG